MSLLSKRLVSIAASILALSLVSAAANADIEVLTKLNDNHREVTGRVTSSYTFNQSMILNSVGFVDYFNSNTYMAYFINGIEQTYSNSISGEDGGIRWLTLSNPTTLQQNDILTVTTGGRPHDGTNLTNLKEFSPVNPSANATFNGAVVVGSSTVLGAGSWSNSNLRVSPSNPGSNVAPEPGSFALALTGGAALLGICVRRRRNAG